MEKEQSQASAMGELTSQGDRTATNSETTDNVNTPEQTGDRTATDAETTDNVNTPEQTGDRTATELETTDNVNTPEQTGDRTATELETTDNVNTPDQTGKLTSQSDFIYKQERYSGIFGGFKWLGDLLLGMPSEVNAFYEEGRKVYIEQMDGVINNVVIIISQGLSQAKTEITNGKQEIQQYVQQLPDDLKGVGQEAAAEIQTKFDDLQQQVNDKQDELVETLAQKYQEKLEAVDACIDEMKAANKGLVQKAFDFVVGVIKTIVELTKMLIQVLARAAAAVGDILKNPVEFFNNLVKAVKDGFLNFVKNIAQYLQQGLMGWLVGTIGGAGIEMPESFDSKGIFSLVT